MNRAALSVRLREWHEKDLQFLLRLRNDIALQALLLATARGSDEQAVRAWLLRRTSGPGLIFRVIADAASDEPIGYIQADRVDERSGEWSFGICLDNAFQGNGNGSAALMALEDTLASQHGAKRLRLKVDLVNERAIRCYANLGYLRTEAAIEQMKVCEQPRDVIEMTKPLAPRGDNV